MSARSASVFRNSVLEDHFHGTPIPCPVWHATAEMQNDRPYPSLDILLEGEEHWSSEELRAVNEWAMAMAKKPLPPGLTPAERRIGELHQRNWHAEAAAHYLKQWGCPIDWSLPHMLYLTGLIRLGLEWIERQEEVDAPEKGRQFIQARMHLHPRDIGKAINARGEGVWINDADRLVSLRKLRTVCSDDYRLALLKLWESTDGSAEGFAPLWQKFHQEMFALLNKLPDEIVRNERVLGQGFYDEFFKAHRLRFDLDNLVDWCRRRRNTVSKEADLLAGQLGHAGWRDYANNVTPLDSNGAIEAHYRSLLPEVIQLLGRLHSSLKPPKLEDVVLEVVNGLHVFAAIAKSQGKTVIRIKGLEGSQDREDLGRRHIIRGKLLLLHELSHRLQAVVDPVVPPNWLSKGQGTFGAKVQLEGAAVFAQRFILRCGDVASTEEALALLIDDMQRTFGLEADVGIHLRGERIDTLALRYEEELWGSKPGNAEALQTMAISPGARIAYLLGMAELEWAASIPDLFGSDPELEVWITALLQGNHVVPAEDLVAIVMAHDGEFALPEGTPPIVIATQAACRKR